MFIYFAPLGFDLCEVGQEEVILKTGKQANRRTMHFALQSLLALFGKWSAQHRWGLESERASAGQTDPGRSGAQITRDWEALFRMPRAHLPDLLTGLCWLQHED